MSARVWCDGCCQWGAPHNHVTGDPDATAFATYQYRGFDVSTPSAAPETWTITTTYVDQFGRELWLVCWMVAARHDYRTLELLTALGALLAAVEEETRQ